VAPLISYLMILLLDFGIFLLAVAAVDVADDVVPDVSMCVSFVGIDHSLVTKLYFWASCDVAFSQAFISFFLVVVPGLLSIYYVGNI